MGILENLTKSLPEALLDLVPGSGIIKGIARVVTGAFDSDDEAQKLLEADPALQVEFQKAVMAHMVEMARADNERIRAENEVLLAVNKTMRAESRSEHWPQYSWRPAWGFSGAASFFAVCLFVCWLCYQAILCGRPEAMVMIPQVIAAFAALFTVGPGAVCGIAALYRGKEKVAKAGEGLGSVMDTASTVAGLAGVAKDLPGTLTRILPSIGGKDK